MVEWITVGMMMVGGAFALLAAVGIVRLPDFYTRMQAASKSTTLGVGCLLLAVAIHFGDLGVTTRVLLTVAFLLLTTPVAAHVIARAAYAAGEPQWKHAVIDEFAKDFVRSAVDDNRGDARTPE
jgi:multicomponent Na+:H+ antiporter subunit G